MSEREKIATLHVVRRYGPVGGMERYVWELTRALAAAGNPVTVICERSHAREQAGIIVHELGVIAQRPRWISLLRFSRRASRWLRERSLQGMLVHSHERLDFHDITTFHGPPFATIFEREWWRLVSLRVWMQLWLERRELFAPSVKAVIPNSQLIKKQLQYYYPGIAAWLAEPIPPGVAPGPGRTARAVPADGGVVGFVGREWQRKGLEVAVAVAAMLRQRRPRLEFWVIGPAPEEVRRLFSGWNTGYRLLGWTDGFSLYPRIDLLLHPARAEPYGMVIAEAMAAQVPVVISDRCGIAPEVEPGSGAVIPMTAEKSVWAEACERELSRETQPLAYCRPWDQVAREYLTCYRSLPGIKDTGSGPGRR